METGASAKISAMSAAGTLTGAELFPCVQGGVNVETDLSTLVTTYIYNYIISLVIAGGVFWGSFTFDPDYIYTDGTDASYLTSGGSYV